MIDAQRKALAVEIVATEALLLDEQRWDEWLALYLEDARFWVPTWRDESRLVEDPDRELSFMFIETRARLAERVQRVVSGRSIASNPIPRTAHLVMPAFVDAVVSEVVNEVVTADAAQDVLVRSSFTSHVQSSKRDALVTYAGRYVHRLAWTDDGFRIRQKTIVVINDRLVSMLDFFYI